MQSLLICIAFHYVEARIIYLNKIINRFLNTYISHNIQIIISSNDTKTSDYIIKNYAHCNNIQVILYTSLEHPYYLTWMHRKQMNDLIDNYDIFMYVEDDMDIPYENFLNYIENFKLLWPNYIPGFIRIETKDSLDYSPDTPSLNDITEIKYDDIVIIDTKKFITLKCPYHAFWILPKKELKDTITHNFVKVSDSREEAAWYGFIELKKHNILR